MKSKFLIIVSLLVGLLIGFFIGQEYTKQKIIKSIGKALSTTSEPDDSEIKGLNKEVKSKNNINVNIGETVELATLKYTVNSVEEKEMIKSKYGQPHLATNGTKFIIVTLTVTNTTSETFDYDDDSPMLETENGAFYQTYSQTISNIDNYLSQRELSPNIPQTGVIVFQLPTSIGRYELLTAKANSNDLYRVRLK